MDDDLKAYLKQQFNQFRAEMSLKMDKVLDRQSLMLAQMSSLEARMEANFRTTQAAMTHFEDRVDRHDVRLRRLEGLDE
jgi:hypothetical protein